MEKIFILLSIMAASFGYIPSASALSVLACEPEWGALTRELAGDKANVYDATTALQDPHRILAKPSLLAKARNADMVVCTGAQLEIGWLPILLQQSGNAKIQPGTPGNFEAARYVKMLDIPTQVDRAQGDVHPGGNPHIQTDPRNIALVAAGLVKSLQTVDPANTAYYQTRYHDFNQRWQNALNRWQKMAAPLKGQKIVVQHKGFPYMENWLGLQEIAALEPKPGVEPSSGHLLEVLNILQHNPAKIVIRAAYNDGRASEWLASRGKIKPVELPFTVGGNAAATNLFSLFDNTLQLLTESLK